MRKIFSTAVTAFLFFLIGYLSPLSAASIDLNDFFFFPGDPVTIAPDGSSAVIGEDPAIAPIILANDPGLGDPEVIVAQPGAVLSFDFEFVEGTAGFNDDEFGAFVLDASTGFSIGSPYEFYAGDSSFGSVSFNLTGLVGQTLGFQFELSQLPGDAGSDSTVMVSNLNIRTAVIPEPSTLFLLGMGLLTTARINRRKKRS